MQRANDHDANQHLKAMFAHSVSQGAYEMMLDTFCNAKALGTTSGSGTGRRCWINTPAR